MDKRSCARFALLGLLGLVVATSLLACGSDTSEGDFPTEEEHKARPEYQAEAKVVSAPNQVYPEEICVDASEAATGESFCFLNGMLNNVPEGEVFIDHGFCPDVRTMGTVSHRVPRYPDYRDSRLRDESYLAEVEWVTSQLKTSGCACCHDSDSGYATVYDFALGPSWVSTVSNRGVILAAGLAGDGVFVTLPPEVNHGFGAAGHVFVSTDSDRMRQFFADEVEYRELDDEDIAGAESFYSLVPFRNVMYEEPEPCPEGVGVDEDGVVRWDLEGVRFLSILQGPGLNPSIPPLDTPEGTIWRYEASPFADALQSASFAYGAAADDARVQRFPASAVAPAQLVPGETYRFFGTARTSGTNRFNCTFTYPIE